MTTRRRFLRAGWVPTFAFANSPGYLAKERKPVPEGLEPNPQDLRPLALFVERSNVRKT
jgi:hypothetical protein